MIYDLIVVGSGSVGAAAGYYATQAGLSVLMIDSAHPPHNQGTHHGESRLIRHAYGEGERYVPLVLRAQTLWDELEQHAGERIMHHSGVLNLAPIQSAFIQNVIDSARQWQLNIEVMQPDEVRKRWPQINVPEGYLGVFEPQSGYLKCEQAVRSWIKLAEQAGCAQLFNCPVSGIGRDGDLQQVTTLDGIYRGRKMLISAGTWVGKLVPNLPVAPTRKVFAWYQADGRYSENNKFPGFTVEMADGSQFYGFPADNNALKVGRHDGGQLMQQPEDRKPFGTVAADGSEAFGFLRQFLPGVGVCLHGEACSYDFSPDEDFIIDTLPDEPNRLLITGLSGHGFKFASVLGELAAEFAQQKPFSFDISPFRLSRF
ncbi:MULTISPECIES: N-methyl-L-tryptophan oxidase [Pantoea]|jgi:N-methyl-L-tryptophan oxidase|uniref:N-methyl-L-tryptophan oxidase n=1 Tax=Pantoea brenneri TaxID=472694 RepID=A0A7Y6TSI5_9GAMM|nr:MULTISPECIES: N-methyl-L-tryptophan oxidase [Pantoea]MBZ6395424.1 N-methyl-L-tryptophan oxidase [Pantoea sp.]MBZ6437202.1 N-methyl-L-tryptophan oxidase [Pantoea sp.]NUY42223.1 N-methyl-L-tryptophan oxidase [Pantoea brenneri]NUY49848.1 N-methyl-L-tryptophan oxidase [Pantoea brenneri]NUY60127.1 N-methyl-L-tryptophan oxidase [Pantoea brenneri]